MNKVIKYCSLVIWQFSIYGCSNNNDLPIESAPIENHNLDFKEHISKGDIQDMRDFELYIKNTILGDLSNQNNGYADNDVKLLSFEDTKTAMKRIQNNTIGVSGIGLWKNQKPYDHMIFEMVANKPTDSIWYAEIQKLINEFSENNISFEIRVSMPDSLLISKE